MVGTVLGTVSYMAPEQALGSAADPRSDLFSLGVVFYEMLAGRLPFQGQSFGEVVDAILHQVPPALARFNYAVTPDVDAVVRRALEKSPEMRYQDARSLYVDLTRLRSMLDDAVRPSSGLAQQRQPGRGRASGKLHRGHHVRQHHARAGRRVDRLGHRRDGDGRPQERAGHHGDRPRARVRRAAQSRRVARVAARRSVCDRDRPRPGRALDRGGRVPAIRPADPDHRAVCRGGYRRRAAQRQDRRRARRDLRAAGSHRLRVDAGPAADAGSRRPSTRSARRRRARSRRTSCSRAG